MFLQFFILVVSLFDRQYNKELPLKGISYGKNVSVH